MCLNLVEISTIFEIKEEEIFEFGGRTQVKVFKNLGFAKLDGVIATELPLEVAASIEGGGGGGNDEGKGKIRWNKVLDVVEAKNQVLFSLPMIFTNVSYYAITLVCVMIAGHHGRLELAGATLGNSWAFVSGFACMSGLSGALESLCGQAFGGKLYRMLGLHLQASCILTIMFASIISVAWFYTQPILILLHQDPHIAKAAALYIKYLIPGLFAYGILQNILRFLQTQSIVIPLLFFSVFSASINFGIAYALVHRTSLGYKGAPVAASISLWISTISLAAYVLFSKRLSHTWQGFSLESLRFTVTNLKLALPSAAMVCLEYWAFEILVFMAGMMPNSQVSTSLIAMCVNTSAVAFMTLYGLSAATSTRVSNELGAGNLDRAKKAMVVSLKLSVLLALIIITMLALGHNIWARFFTGDNHEIINPFASLTPFLVISIAVDSIQVVLSGVARGCGWQHLVVWANLATFYFIGIPIAAILGFKLKLHVKGLWIGLICGLFCQTGILLLIALCRKWRKIDMTERKENENPIYV